MRKLVIVLASAFFCVSSFADNTPRWLRSSSISPDGKTIAFAYQGVEDPLRKHHTSSVTRDVWACKDGVYTKLSTYVGENRNPVFASDGDSFWFLREDVKDNPIAPEACFNVWRSSVSDPSKQTKVTSFEKWPVRGLSASSDGTLLFSWNGDRARSPRRD